MPAQERQFRYETEKVKDLAYPNQGVRLVDNRAFVALDGQENELEVSYSLGRFIYFALSLRKKRDEVSSFDEIISERLRNLLSLSNCHRTMLVAIGYKFKDVLDDNFGISILLNYFNHNKITITQLEEKIMKSLPSEFPISVNLFSPQTGDLTSVEPIHSFVILGIDNKGRILCFHKDGYNDDDKVELTDIQDILKDYAGRKISYVTAFSQIEVDKILEAHTH